MHETVPLVSDEGKNVVQKLQDTVDFDMYSVSLQEFSLLCCQSQAMNVPDTSRCIVFDLIHYLAL